MRKVLITSVVALLIAGAGYFLVAKNKAATTANKPVQTNVERASSAQEQNISRPSISVERVRPANFIESVFVTGTLVAKDQVLVAPEVEGLRVVEIKAEIGDHVKKGQTLAVLQRTTLETQLAQNSAALARDKAALAQAKSNVADREARVTEAVAQLKRAKPLKSKGYLSGSTLDSRRAAERTARAQLQAARDGIAVAEADLLRTQAERKDIEWRLSKTEIKAPEDGLISRRNVRVGGLASSATDAMFYIIENGTIELDGEITEVDLAKVSSGQAVKIEVAGVGEITGRVRLVSPEVDKNTRLGHIRVTLAENPKLKIGAFARGRIDTVETSGLAVPTAAILYDSGGQSVLGVESGLVKKKNVKIGARAQGRVQILNGLKINDLVVSKSGTFLRDGDLIKPILQDPKVSEVR